MRVLTTGARAQRTRCLRLGFAVYAYGLAAVGLGQEIADGKKNPPAQSPAPQQKSQQSKKPAPTFTKDIASILQSKCQSCHRRHQAGPFALETYEQARKRSRDIAAVTEGRLDAPLEADPRNRPHSQTRSIIDS